jgi:SAM-dependent methyltransferase
MEPNDVGAQHTLEPLIERREPGRSLLEIGCGDGRLAAELARCGHRIVAVDSDSECVGLARRRGVDARHATWPETSDSLERFDVVLFTRSLHHCSDLDAALEAASRVLRPSGILWIDDFDHSAGPRLGARWLVTQARALHRTGLLPRGGDSPWLDEQAARDPEGAWHRVHDHDLHGWAAMESSARARFAATTVETTPYLFRYLIPLVHDSDRGARVVRAILERERKELSGAWVGRRLVGAP